MCIRDRNGIGGLKLVDLNSDGFLDILATAYVNDRLVWYPNDGLGNFPTENIISDTVLGASGVALGDINNDTFIDIAITSYDGNEVVWFSGNGTGTFILEANKIDTTLSAPGAVNMSDIDGDGDLDALVATATYSGDVLEIFRNDLIPGGTVSFTKDALSVATGKIGLFNAAFEDLDGDANLDILATEVSCGGFCGNTPGNLYWFEDNGAGFTETVFTTSIANPSVAQFRDLDNDGLNDIILSSGTSGAGNDLVWFKNNGGGSFDPEVVIDATQSQTFVYSLTDFDADGDLDIASCAYNQDALNYFENQRIVLSTPSLARRNISIYPNPTKEFLNFEGLDAASIEVSIFDILGKNVLKTSLSTNESLDVSKLGSGIYSITIDGTFASKFIKE